MESSDENKLYLIVLGVVAGFIGHRILPRVARGLEERMDLTEKEAIFATKKADDAVKETEKAQKEAEKAQKEAEKAQKEAEKAQNITYAITLIETKAYKKAEKILLSLGKTDPLNPLINFKLANMYKRMEDFAKAVNLTSKYIEAMRAANKENDEEFGVALYNRACYRTKQALSSPRSDELLSKAFDDLERAIEFDPARRGYAWQDEDFEKLRKEGNPRFAEICRAGEGRAMPF
jgi:hypothetical protein